MRILKLFIRNKKKKNGGNIVENRAHGEIKEIKAVLN